MAKKKTDFDVGPIRARLQEYYAVESLNNSSFEKRCGLYNGFVGSMDEKIHFETLAKIAAACPNLNLGWLFSGVGDMLIGEQAKPKSVQAVAPAVNMENVQAVFITNVDAIASAVAKVLGGK